MKVIKTKYAGHSFRSRLEARWVIFLDYLNITWVYESDGFVLEGVGCYLPDFYLPTFNGGMYLEVKPNEMSAEEYNKCVSLCNESGKDIWLAEGIPSARAYKYLSKSESDGKVYCVIGVPNFDKAFLQDRMFEYPDWDGWKPYALTKYILSRCNGGIYDAALAANEESFDSKKTKSKSWKN